MLTIKTKAPIVGQKCSKNVGFVAFWQNEAWLVKTGHFELLRDVTFHPVRNQLQIQKMTHDCGVIFTFFTKSMKQASRIQLGYTLFCKNHIHDDNQLLSWWKRRNIFKSTSHHHLIQRLCIFRWLYPWHVPRFFSFCIQCVLFMQLSLDSLRIYYLCNATDYY